MCMNIYADGQHLLLSRITETAEVPAPGGRFRM